MRSRRMRRIRAGVLLTLFALLTWFASSFIPAMFNPSYGVSMGARAAEWARGHGLGFAVNHVETWWYELNPPKIGGKPPTGSFVGVPLKKTSDPLALSSPPRLRSPAGRWLAGEGVWHPAGRTVDGVPTILTTTVRP